MGDAEQIFRKRLLLSHERVGRCIRPTESDLIKRGMFGQGPGLEKYSEDWFECLRSDILTELEKVKPLNLTEKEWDSIYEIAQSMIKSQVDFLIQYFGSTWSTFPDSFRDKLIIKQDDLISVVESFAEGQKSLIKAQKDRDIRTKVWELFKILLSLIVGYVLGKIT